MAKQSRSSRSKSKTSGNSSTQQTRSVQRIGALVNQLLARRGYAETMASDQLLTAIASELHGDLGNQIVVGKMNRGVLMVFATDSVVLQELTFQKRKILKRIQKEMPQANITDLRFKVQNA